MELRLKGKLLLVVILLLAFTSPLFGQSTAETFTNPLVTSRDSADPWMVYHGGYYYFTATLDPAGGIWVWKSRTLAGLDSGVKVKVHTPDADKIPPVDKIRPPRPRFCYIAARLLQSARGTSGRSFNSSLITFAGDRISLQDKD